MTARGPSRRSLLALALSGLLPGCGFRPVYAARDDGTVDPVDTSLAAINIGLIPERVGQVLREALQQRFEGTGNAVAYRYDLAVSYGIAGEAIGIRQDAAGTRVRMVGSATWTLRAQDMQRSTLASGTARVVDGYNAFDNQGFTADLESEAVQVRMSHAVAEKIALQIASYFHQHAST